jgi:hypothetical protein
MSDARLSAAEVIAVADAAAGRLRKLFDRLLPVL